SQPGINGGMVRRQGVIDGQAVIAYVCTIDVPNVDEYLGKATSGGGTVALPKMAVQGVGWLAYAKDTEGNIFGLMQRDPAAK
ncbi:MAG: VOC family protein, partial [Gemmataceae bacterium]